MEIGCPKCGYVGTERYCPQCRSAGRIIRLREIDSQLSESDLKTLLTYPGLGDLMITIPLAYLASESGWDPNIEYTFPRAKGRFPLTYPPTYEFNHLPLLNSSRKGATNPVDLHSLPCFDWKMSGPILDSLAKAVDLKMGSAPRTPLLEPSTGSKERVRQIVGEEEYILLAIGGHWQKHYKELSQEQIAAIAESVAFKVAVVHSSPSEVPLSDNILNLTGETTVRELDDLITYARMVISPDSGVMHLALSHNVPTLCLLSNLINRERIPYYMPALYLQAEHSSKIPTQDIVSGISTIEESLRTPWAICGPDRETCGISEYAERMSQEANVPFLTPQDKFNGIRIIEWHGNDRNLWKVGREDIVSIHSFSEDTISLIRSAGGAIIHSYDYYDIFRKSEANIFYTPLPCYQHRAPGSVSNPPIILWHGIILRSKGVRNLIEAFKQVRSKIENIQLHIIGSIGDAVSDPEEMDYLIQQREQGLSTEIRKYWSRNELWERMSQASMFCYLDTIDSEQSAVASEALGYSRPVIVSSSSKYNDIRNWVTTTNGPEETAQKIIEFCNSSNLYHQASYRSWLGASYRQAHLIARQYRAIVQHTIVNKK